MGWSSRSPPDECQKVVGARANRGTGRRSPPGGAGGPVIALERGECFQHGAGKRTAHTPVERTGMVVHETGCHRQALNAELLAVTKTVRQCQKQLVAVPDRWAPQSCRNEGRAMPVRKFDRPAERTSESHPRPRERSWPTRRLSSSLTMGSAPFAS